jgi:hypothetical protein
MTTTNIQYGTTVAEIFPHSDEELQELINKRTTRYNNNSEGLYYKAMGAHVDWVKHAPVEMSIIELQDVLKEGFTIIKVITDVLYFKAILRKPDDVIAAELLKVAELAREEYNLDRYERNRVETARLVAIRVEESERAAAEAAAKAAAKRQGTEEQKALADLLKVHNKPAQVAV